MAGERVVSEEGLVLDFGLFPASDPEARVLLESSASPSGYRSRSLLARELGNLWDIPILFLDSLSDLEVRELMAIICKSPPSKLLHTGADLLLTSVFRGGLAWREGQEGHTAGAVPGPRPCSDADFGLSPACEQEHPPETKLTMEEFALAEEIIKGDLQKADNAAVPDNLWLRAFVLGYGKLGCLARHLGALGQTEGTAGFLGGLTPPMGWQGALPGLRCFALRYWHSLVTRGYISWRRANVPLPVARSGEGQLQLVLYHWEWWQGVGYPVYEWPLGDDAIRPNGDSHGPQRMARPQWRQAMMPYTAAMMQLGSSGQRVRPLFFGIGGRNIREKFEMDNPIS